MVPVETPEARGQVFRTSDGVRLVYDDVGTGQPVVLLHGYTGSRKHFRVQEGFLVSHGYRVLSLDRRHSGDSDFPVFGQRMSRQGLDLREFLSGLELEDAVLVGHSMGVSVCLSLFALFGTGGVSKFVAVDQSPRIVNDDEWHWGVRGVTWDLVYPMTKRLMRFGQPEVEPGILPSIDVDFEGSRWEDYPHDRVEQLLIDHFVADWRDVLPRIDVPTWVVTGRRNPYYDVEGMEWFAAQIPGGRLTCFEHSGHSPQWTEPDRFNAQLLDFLTT